MGMLILIPKQIGYERCGRNQANRVGKGRSVSGFWEHCKGNSLVLSPQLIFASVSGTLGNGLDDCVHG